VSDFDTHAMRSAQARSLAESRGLGVTIDTAFLRMPRTEAEFDDDSVTFGLSLGFHLTGTGRRSLDEWAVERAREWLDDALDKLRAESERILGAAARPVSR